MRYYGFLDWLNTVSRTTGIDIRTLRARYIDPQAALLALSAAGGPDNPSRDQVDTAAACTRLLFCMVDLRPYRGVSVDRVIHESVKELAQRRGWQLNLGSQALLLIEQVCAGDMSEDEMHGRMHAALRPSPDSAVDLPAGITETVFDLCHPVTEATHGPADGSPASSLIEQVSLWLSQSGAKVLRPTPANRTTAGGGRQEPAHTGPRPPTSSTREIFRSSVERMTTSCVVIIVNTGDPSGVYVEREWALRLGLPVFEFLFKPDRHPHQDGPGLVEVIEVEQGGTREAVARFQELVQDRAWRIRDTKAYLEAIRFIDAPILEEVRAAWQALEVASRERVAQAARMSRAYIEGNLSSPLGLNLFSERQFAALERMLQVHPQRLLQASPKLLDSEVALLTTAALDAGLVDHELVQAVIVGSELWRRPAMRGALTDPVEARQCIARAIKAMRRGK